MPSADPLSWLAEPHAIEAFEGPDEPAHHLAVVWALGHDRFGWMVVNDHHEARPVWSVRVTFDLGRLPEPVRLLCHGWQSWSATKVRTLGVDRDPATSDVPGLLRQMHHADPAPSRDELRSELVAVLDAPGAPRTCVGFDAGHDHDGTWRLARDERGHVLLTAEAFLGGAVLAPGEQRALHGVTVTTGDDHHTLLAGWAARVGTEGGARTTAPYQVGWCSWYHWFTGVTEADVLDTVARSADWPFGVLQVDDGYQHDIGDWLTTNDTFPSGVAAIADAITGAGRTAGIWTAPFVAMGASDTASRHPTWLAHWRDDRPLVGNRNPAWGGDALVLDVTQPEVLAHLEDVARQHVAMGFTYLKLDFLYAAHVPGRFADPTLTPAQRVRRGLEAVRRGAGPGTFLLGCGCPLGPAVGIVDGMRIGPDVDPSWGLAYHHRFIMEAYADVPPSTRNAWQATLGRTWMHRRLWLNDPDCLMLRHEHTQLTAEQAATWARAVGLSGGMAIVSDDLDLLGAPERALLDEVLALGRAADAEAAAGLPARVADLLEHAPARSIEAAGHRLTLTDVESGASTLT
jgi:alpha-galactosidase